MIWTNLNQVYKIQDSLMYVLAQYEDDALE